jgi:Zn-dependent protease
MDIDMAALRDGVLRFIILVLSLSLHEWGHAIVADKLGDDTPRSQGRVTLYPLAHIDFVGTILIPALGALGFFGNFAMIGWAKPIYTNPANFRRRNFDQALVTIAGPGVNVLLAAIGTIGAAIAVRTGSYPFREFCQMLIIINVALFVFNLLPIPPLDGSKFFMYWFGMAEETYMRISLYGSFALLLLINVPAFRELVSHLIAIGLIPFTMLFRVLT